MKEFAELTAFAKLDGWTITKWDGAYYSEKLKQELFNLDDEKLKPYFQLESIDGAFTVAQNYTVHFEETLKLTNTMMR
jgi:peptidyl-dipeptidase Dcp